MKLHQLGVIPLETKEEAQGFMVDELFWNLTEIVEENPEFKNINSFELRALDEVINLRSGYMMSDFLVARRDTNGV